METSGGNFWGHRLLATSDDVNGDVGGGVDGDVWWSCLVTREMK